MGTHRVEKIMVMEDILTIPFQSALKGQALPVLMLCAAVGWVQRNNVNLIKRMDSERSAHLEALSKQIEDLKRSVSECSEDRKALWRKLSGR